MDPAEGTKGTDAVPEQSLARLRRIVEEFDEHVRSLFPSVPRTAKGRYWVDPLTGDHVQRAAFYVKVIFTADDVEGPEEVIRGKLKAAEKIMVMMVEAAQPLAALGAPIHVLKYMGTGQLLLLEGDGDLGDVECRVGGYLVSRLLSGFPYKAAPVIR